MKVTNQKNLTFIVKSVLWIKYCIYMTDSLKEINSAIKTIFNMAVNYLHWIHSNHYRNVIPFILMLLHCELLCSKNFLIAIIVLRKNCLIDINYINRFIKKRFHDACISFSELNVFRSIILIWKLLFIVNRISHWA